MQKENLIIQLISKLLILILRNNILLDNLMRFYGICYDDGRGKFTGYILPDLYDL